MKLIITIPAYNEEATIASVIKEIPRQILGIDKVEVLVLNDGSHDATARIAAEAGADYVISHHVNKGLARTFSDALKEAISKDADIIVNTDADNHYDQSRIPELIQPILTGNADIVVGSRMIEHLDGMRKINKYGNIIGSWFVRKLFGLGHIDVSSGFRAYTRHAAMNINVLSRHTYTHETLIQAKDLGLMIVDIPIKARQVFRKSRLIKNIPSHITKSMFVILRSFTLYKPLRAFSFIGLIIFFPGLVLLIRFFYFYVLNGGQGHIQSLIIAAICMLLGFQIFILGLIASAIGWNRKMIEEILYRLKKEQNIK